MMKRIILILYAGMAAVLGTATVLERLYGSDFAEVEIYHSAWFCVYWGVLAALTVAVCLAGPWRRRWSVMLLHLAFVVVLGGALVSFLTARKGLVHLPQGVPVKEYLSEETGRYHQLPFTLLLDSFRIQEDPVSGYPADYVSYVRLDGSVQTISMNRILSHRSVRLYQSSYDEETEGSWLSLNCDPWGIPVTYTGYGLLAVAWILLLFSGKETFLRLGGRGMLVSVLLTVGIVVGITAWFFLSRQSTMMPVLRSGWFVSHVSLVSTAYFLLALIWVFSLVGLCKKSAKRREQLALWNRVLLFPAVGLLTAGIFVGAVWANVSWGRYWGWDPKEVWALITLMVYAVPLHASLLPRFRQSQFLQTYLAIAFLAVLATYFGVNLLLGGMHAYT